VATKKSVFITDKAAVTGGPYSQAIICNGLIYISGQGVLCPETNRLKTKTIEEEATLGLENIGIIFRWPDTILKY
jgi:2-iminobutanoate/2-iminopropanoate deaminase